MNDIFKTIIRGLITSMGLRVIAMGLRFLTICLLPLWMSPYDIGLVALILACVNLPVIFADFGFGTAIIKEKNATDRMFRSVFTFVAISSTIITTALILGAPVIENIFSLPAILTLIAAFALPFNAFAIVPNAILQRELRFTPLAIRDLIGEIVFSGTSIFLAIRGYGAFSIAIAAVIMRMVRWAIASFAVQWKPELCLNLSDLRQLTRFSLYQFASLSITQIFNQVDKLLLAAYLSPTSLGFYSQAQQFTIYPVQTLSGTANNVFFSSFSKIQDDDKTLRQLFTKILRVLILVSGLAVGILSPAMHLIPIIYRPEWVNAVPIAQTMCLFLPAFCAFLFEGTMIAIGGEKKRVISNLTKLILLVIGTISIFTFFPDINGSIAIAAILGSAMLISACMNLKFILKRLQINSIRPFIKPILIAVIIAAAGVTVGFMI